MANSNGQPYISGTPGNQTINIPISGGNASVNLNTGAVSLSNGSVSDTGNVLTGTETLKAGPVSLTISANGNNSVTFNTGIVSTTLNFQPTENSTTDITGATVSGSYYGVGASISIQESGSSWIGTVAGGFQAPGNNSFSNWINSYTAPPGKHVLHVFGGHAPYELKDGDWSTRKGDLVERALGVLEEFAPGFSDGIIDMQVLAPPDIEAIIGSPHGHIFHGELQLDQLFWARPVPHFADYRSPIKGLYQCGSSAHPGGGVGGVVGRNSAREILRDRGLA